MDQRRHQAPSRTRTPRQRGTRPSIVEPQRCQVDEHTVAVAALVFDDDRALRRGERSALETGGVSTYTVERGDGEEMLVIVGPPASVDEAATAAREHGIGLALSPLLAESMARGWLDLLRESERRGATSLRQSVRWPAKTGRDQ